MTAVTRLARGLSLPAHPRGGGYGLRESVRRRYERLCILLDEELGLEPESATRALFRDLLGQR
jgi:hypothetical protein